MISVKNITDTKIKMATKAGSGFSFKLKKDSTLIGSKLCPWYGYRFNIKHDR